MMEEREYMAAAQQAGRAEKMPPGLIGGAAKIAEPEIPAALNEAEVLAKRIAEIRNELHIFVDRMLVGDAPQTACGGSGERLRRSHNAGITGQLRHTIEQATETADDALRLIRRLSQIG